MDSGGTGRRAEGMEMRLFLIAAAMALAGCRAVDRGGAGVVRVATEPGVASAVAWGVGARGLPGTRMEVSHADGVGGAWSGVSEDVDALVLEDVREAWMVQRHPFSLWEWRANTIVLVGRGDVGVEDVASGRVEIAVALEGTGLGRATREALEAAGLWTTVSPYVGRFDSARAILERARWGEPAIGAVYRTDYDRDGRGLRILMELEAPVGHGIVAWTEAGRAFARGVGAREMGAR